MFNVLTGTLRYLTLSVNTHRSSPNLQFGKWLGLRTAVLLRKHHGCRTEFSRPL